MMTEVFFILSLSDSRKKLAKVVIKIKGNDVSDTVYKYNYFWA